MITIQFISDSGISGVTIGAAAVVPAGAIVTKDVAPRTVVAGNPGKFIKKRVLNG